MEILNNKAEKLQEIETKLEELTNARKELLAEERKQAALNAVGTNENGDLVLKVWMYSDRNDVEQVLNEFYDKGYITQILMSTQEAKYYSPHEITIKKL